MKDIEFLEVIESPAVDQTEKSDETFIARDVIDSKGCLTKGPDAAEWQRQVRSEWD